MKISAESTLRVTVRVAYVVTANLAFTANCTNFAHDDTSVRKIDLLKYSSTFDFFWQAKKGVFNKKIKIIRKSFHKDVDFTIKLKKKSKNALISLDLFMQMG
jgi:hypothetical protein